MKKEERDTTDTDSRRQRRLCRSRIVVESSSLNLSGGGGGGRRSSTSSAGGGGGGGGLVLLAVCATVATAASFLAQPPATVTAFTRQPLTYSTTTMRTTSTAATRGLVRPLSSSARRTGTGGSQRAVHHLRPGSCFAPSFCGNIMTVAVGRAAAATAPTPLRRCGAGAARLLMSSSSEGAAAAGSIAAGRSDGGSGSSSSSSSGAGKNPVPTGVDVVVVGGGHAGCEAAAASARTGARTVLVTQKKETIGELSCNPSIGGIGKGHLVREVDALDGVMGRVIDRAGIHFRMLNRSKGPAVRGPRAQADRDLYRAAMQEEMMGTPNLSVFEGSVEDVLLDGDVVRGIVTTGGTEIACNGVVVTTGTFLRGKCYIGQEWYWAGRHLRDSAHVEPPSVGLAETLERFEFPLGRLKTGTPPRIDGNTINWGVLEGQPSEEPPVPFSYLNAGRGVSMKDNLISCAKTYTNEETHKIVMANAHTLPEPSVDGVGPRYCPSIYKKVERFRDRTQHLSFLEPEGLNTNVVYPNGMSGPFPVEVQYKIMRSMKGLEEVEIIRPAYDVEYDYVDPRSCRHTLETKKIRGLFLAGQICGTTGYEEAAAQGIVAGANAGLKAVGRPEFTVGRDEGYIGVLIDDLVTKGADEPYRMFTSRAEYRLYMRADNADLRLTGKGFGAGLVCRERMGMMMEREGAVARSLRELRRFSLTVEGWQGYGVAGDFSAKASADGRRKNAAEIVQLPDVPLDLVEAAIKDWLAQDRLDEMKKREQTLETAYRALGPEETLGDRLGDRDPLEVLEEMKRVAAKVPSDVREFEPTPDFAKETVEATCKYMNYMDRQIKEMEGYRKNQDLRIPEHLEYTHETLPSMSSEELEKLKEAKPETFAAASQLQGLTPHSLVYLYNHVTRKMKNRDTERAKEMVTHHFMEADEVKETLSAEQSSEQSSASSPSSSATLSAASASTP